MLTSTRSYGTAKSGVGISAMSVLRPDLMMKCSIPVVMAGIIAVSLPLFPYFVASLACVVVISLYMNFDILPFIDLRTRRISTHRREMSDIISLPYPYALICVRTAPKDGDS